MSAAERAPVAIPETPSPETLVRVTDVAITHLDAATATPASVSFAVSPGEVMLVLGPSGSGKSTLALALNGLIPHAVPATITGTVEVAGIDTATASVARLSTEVAMVFQDPDAQLVTGTLLDEVAFGPENLKLPVDEVMARVETALRRVGLWERRDENPDRLSGGGRQRLAIACALAMGSPLLVLDEPTANLDPVGTAEVYAALRDVVATGDRAIVLVEHNLDAAIEFVDRVVVMDAAGRLLLDDPARESLRSRAEELDALGVWLPTSLRAALRLRDAGYALDPLPLTAAELRAALIVTPEPRVRVAADPPHPPHQPQSPSVHDTPRPRTDTRRVLDTRGEERPVIEVRGLTVTRGRKTILEDIDLEVQRGDFLAVVGENGAGKTTLAHAIAGVVPPPRGRVRVGDMDPGRTDSRHLSREIGFVFQNPEHQFVAHTVFDELAHGLRLRHVADDEVRARVDEMLQRFGLEDKAQQHPFLLSGGQKRRLSVGTALIAGASVLVLDEPTFGQDRARADELLGLLDELHRSGTTIIVVTHDMQLVAEHATRTVVLSHGRLRAVGPTRDILADRALLRDAGLLPPPLAEALDDLPQHPRLSGIVRIADLPGGRS